MTEALSTPASAQEIAKGFGLTFKACTIRGAIFDFATKEQPTREQGTAVAEALITLLGECSAEVHKRTLTTDIQPVGAPDTTPTRSSEYSISLLVIPHDGRTGDPFFGRASQAARDLRDGPG